MVLSDCEIELCSCSCPRQFLYHYQSSCCMQTKLCSITTNYTVASPESVLVFFNMKYKPKTLSLSLCVQLRRSWSAWTRRGLWCAGRVSACQTWTVTKSLGGSPAAAWRASWSSPAHRRSERSPHTNTHALLQRGEGFRGTRQRDWTRDSGGNITEEEDQRRDSQRHCMLRWQGHKTLDGLSGVWKETRDWEQSQMERNAESEGHVAHRQTISHWREDSHKRSKNSWDDLFIFCSSEILFHTNVSVLK